MITDQIETIIKASIPGARVAVVDPYSDGQHFEAYVVSAAFEGLPLVRQHKMVLNSLKTQLSSNAVHAVALKTFTPAKWESDKARYSVEIP